MKYFALGGLNYPIGRFLPSFVEDSGTRLWTDRAIRNMEKLIQDANDDVFLIGFSKGAQVAIELALSLYTITKVIAHSPGNFSLPKNPTFYPRLNITLIMTNGDKLTPVTATWDTWDKLLKIGIPATHIKIDPLPFQKPLGIMERFMQNRCHQFHNAVDFINEKINQTNY